MKGTLISFVICEAEVGRGRKEAVQVPAGKSAPHYFEKSVPQQFILGQEKTTVMGRSGMLFFKVYMPNFLLVEARFEVTDIFSDEIVGLKEGVIAQCAEYLKKYGGKDVEEFSEEYTTYVVTEYEGEPERFLKHRDTIAGLLKSEKLLLDPSEVEYTLTFQLKYAKDDLVVLDWDGAFIFEPAGEFESTLELIQLANFQLLRYRVLDKELDQRLERVSRVIEETPPSIRFFFTPRDVHQALRQMVFLRSRSISEFQLLEREIKLIGDWYSTRLYELIGKKFRLEEWRAVVKDKLDALEDIYTIASENFTISWEQRSRIFEMIGWYVLLVGWFVLLLLDIYFYKFK